MAVVFLSPSKYIQGAGELNNLGIYTEKYGKSALCLISEGGKRRHEKQIEDSFAKSEATVKFEIFNGECCSAEIDRLVHIVWDGDTDVIIGVGGGKIFDTAKAVAYFSRKPVVICPTIASTDAPCSALSVIYTEDGTFEQYLFLPANPNLVLMDTEVIAASPVRFTIAGMGDAMATYFEARACCNSGAKTCAGGQVSIAALGIARLCYETLITEGPKAKLALEAHALTPAVEKVIEANTLLSGIGFESGGLAGAHAIHNGLTVLPECHSMQHGEKVNFGTITQLVLENTSDEELSNILDWMITVGLPVTLAELGITDTSREHLLPAAQAACAESDTLHNLPVPVSPGKVVDAILAADAYGKRILSQKRHRMT